MKLRRGQAPWPWRPRLVWLGLSGRTCFGRQILSPFKFEAYSASSIQEEPPTKKMVKSFKTATGKPLPSSIGATIVLMTLSIWRAWKRKAISNAHRHSARPWVVLNKPPFIQHPHPHLHSSCPALPPLVQHAASVHARRVPCWCS